MLEVSLSEYTNTIDELIPYNGKKAAQECQRKNHTDDTCIFTPFIDENGQTKLLIPGPLDSSSFPESLNSNLRIIAADNPTKRKGLFTRFKHWCYQNLGMHYVRHINDLIGDTINLNENKIIIILKQVNEDDDYLFKKFIEEENQKISAQFKEKLFSGKPLINDAEFLENISKLAEDLKLEGAMTYFIFKEKDGSKKILRQTFKNDNCKKAIEYLKHEKEIQQARSVELKPHKYKNYLYLDLYVIG